MLLEKIQGDMQQSMKDRNQHKVDTLRGLISELKKWKVDNPEKEYTDEIEIQILRKAVKQRQDSISQFDANNRSDLSVSEKEELIIIEEYLPQLMNEEDIKKVVIAKKLELGILDKSGMGKLMGSVMQEIKGQADGQLVKKLVEDSL